MNTIDTRDLYKRKCELEALRDDLSTAQDELKEAKKSKNPTEIESAQDAVEAAELEFDTDEQKELAELETLESEISDFRHGETLIPEGDFEDYACQFASDTCEIPDTWPCNCIDWAEAAKELAQDYTTVSYQGEDYYVRA